MNYKERKPIEDETFRVLVDAYNQTPPNFIPPSDDIIEKVI
jgi:nicotinamidase-related amidase